MEQVLEKLFESIPKVRILRIFMQNADRFFTFPEITERSRVKVRQARKEVSKLLKIGILKRKKARIKYEIRGKSREKGRKPSVIFKTKKAEVFYANPGFKLLAELRELVIKSSVASRKKILQQIKGLGKVKLAILSGIFLHNENARTDLFIVGDAIKRGRLEHFLSQLESDLGRSINYTCMDTAEFKYRLNMYDRFLRDLLENNNEKLINKFHI